MLDAGPIAELAIAAETSRLERLRVHRTPRPERHDGSRRGGHQSLDPFVALSHVAAVTTELQAPHLRRRAPVPESGIAGEVRRHRRQAVEWPASSSVSARATSRPSTTRSASTSTSATCCSTKRSTCCRSTGRASRSTTRARISTAAARSAGPARRSSRSRSGSAATPQLTLRRVAERAQGWMPLTGPAGMFADRALSGGQLDRRRSVERLDMLKDLAGDRFDGLDITIAYTDPSIHDLSRDIERHRDAIGRCARSERRG